MITLRVKETLGFMEDFPGSKDQRDIINMAFIALSILLDENGSITIERKDFEALDVKNTDIELSYDNETLILTLVQKRHLLSLNGEDKDG